MSKYNMIEHIIILMGLFLAAVKFDSIRIYNGIITSPINEEDI
jgi:hypothetical protein